MSTFRILVSTSARLPQWQLAGYLGTSTSILLGWRQAPRPIDGGVPTEVATVISNTLCRVARVSYLSSDLEEIMATHSKEFYSIQPITELGLVARLAAHWSGVPPHAAVVSTNNPKVALHLFDANYFSWVLQGQSVFLSDLSDPLPDLRDVVSKAWQKKYEDAPLEAINDYSLIGIMRPGVDGDVAGFLFRSVAHKESFLRGLREEAESNGMQFKVCNEAEFMDSLAGESVDASHHSEH